MKLDTIPPQRLAEYVEEDDERKVGQVQPEIITLTARTARDASGSQAPILIPDNDSLCRGFPFEDPLQANWLEIPLRLRHESSLGKGGVLDCVWMDSLTEERTGLCLIPKYDLTERQGETCSVWWSPGVLCTATEFGDILEMKQGRVIRSECSDFILARWDARVDPSITLRMLTPTAVEGGAGREVHYDSFPLPDQPMQTVPLFTGRGVAGEVSTDLKFSGGYWTRETPDWLVAKSCSSTTVDRELDSFVLQGSLVVNNWQSGIGSGRVSADDNVIPMGSSMK